MLRFIFLSVAVYLIYKYLKKAIRRNLSLHAKNETNSIQTTELKKCDECEKFKDQSQMIEKDYHVFCSRECYTKFFDKHN